jgi:hypothetical protein
MVKLAPHGSISSNLTSKDCESVECGLVRGLEEEKKEKKKRKKKKEKKKRIESA